jgi:hypothetical protein
MNHWNRFLRRWDAVNFALLCTLIVLSMLLSGCASPTIPVGTFAITVHESPSSIVSQSSDKPKELVAWIVTRSDCYPCKQFHDTRGDGLDGLRYRYIQTDRPKPSSCPDAVWNAAVEGGKTRPVPFAMWRSRIQIGDRPPGHYTATAVLGLTHEQLREIVAYSGDAE